MKHFVAALLLAGSLVLIPSHAMAQGTVASIESFRLSMDKVNATVAGMTNLVELLGHDETLAKTWKAEAQKQERQHSEQKLGDFSSVVEHVGQKDARVMTAFAKAGITPRESEMTLATLMSSLLGLAVEQSSGKPNQDLKSGFARDNIDFVKAHKEEIRAALRKVEALKAKYPGLALDSDREEEK